MRRGMSLAVVEVHDREETVFHPPNQPAERAIVRCYGFGTNAVRASMVSAGVSTRGALRACEQPALLIHRSRPPSRCTAKSARASTADSSRTSHARPCTPLQC